MACPAELYHRSVFVEHLRNEDLIVQHAAKDVPSRVGTYDYPGHFLVRRVSRCGTIRLTSSQPSMR